MINLLRSIIQCLPSLFTSLYLLKLQIEVCVINRGGKLLFRVKMTFIYSRPLQNTNIADEIKQNLADCRWKYRAANLVDCIWNLCLGVGNNKYGFCLKVLVFEKKVHGFYI